MKKETNKKNKTYAYERKTIIGLHYNYSVCPELYNHSCVIKKKLLNEKQEAILKTLQERIKEIEIIKSNYIKDILKESERE
jgi:tryptophanyl-tRNA synthetase